MPAPIATFTRAQITEALEAADVRIPDDCWYAMRVPDSADYCLACDVETLTDFATFFGAVRDLLGDEEARHDFDSSTRLDPWAAHGLGTAYWKAIRLDEPTAEQREYERHLLDAS